MDCFFRTVCKCEHQNAVGGNCYRGDLHCEYGGGVFRNWKLFTPKERQQYFVEFLADGLMRGDLKSQYDALSVAINNGWMCPDEAREILNQNPMPNGQGEIYRVPLNTMPADIAKDWWLAKVKGGDTTNGKGAS